jgi:hypothetical protein
MSVAYPEASRGIKGLARVSPEYLPTSLARLLSHHDKQASCTLDGPGLREAAGWHSSIELL